jgi:flagellar hook-associated protein 1 FlgK
MENLSITDVNKLALPEKGRITVGSTYYYYDSWSADLDADGNLTSITFNLKEVTDADEQKKQAVSQAQIDSMTDKTLTCGETVDSMGIPYYQAQINEFLRCFTEAFNEIEESGVDLNGNQMGAFFVGTSATGTDYDMSDWEAKPTTITSGSDTYYKITASTICVNAQSLKDPSYFSTATSITDGVAKYDVVEKLLALQNQSDMFRGDDAESFLETLLSDITVDVNKNEISSTNYTNIVTVVANQRTSVSGVDEDEEALNLIKFQNAYNLASKVISVMAELYDKLINETGVT